MLYVFTYIFIHVYIIMIHLVYIYTHRYDSSTHSFEYLTAATLDYFEFQFCHLER